MPTSRPRRPEPLNEALQAELAARIEAELGLAFPQERRCDLNRLLRLAALDLGGEAPETWLHELAARAWPGSLRNQLAGYLTVGETYFFRDPDALEHLAAQHLAPLIQARRAAGQRRLRLWSAGCCTGEEAYSLALVLERLLPDAEAWQLECLGSDVNPAFLDKARLATYGDWSFRKGGESLKRLCFSPQGRGLWQLNPAVARRVRFFVHNLAVADYPDPARGLAECDLILCRNVLMYFGAEAAHAALRRLWHCLSDSGLLLLSAVEAGLAGAAGLSGELIPGGLALRRNALPRASRPAPAAPIAPVAHAEAPRRKPVPVPAPPPAPTAAPPPDMLWAEAQASLARGEHAEAIARLERYLERNGLPLARQAEAALLLARAQAGLQQLALARQWAEHALELDRFQAGAYWLIALVHQDRAEPELALQALHKALYLDPDFILAHYLSGLLQERLGARRKARKAFATCLALLAERAPEAPVPEGDGLSGAQLHSLCSAKLAAERV